MAEHAAGLAKPEIAILRGPNLNRWEMQNFIPLGDQFAFRGITSVGNNFALDEIPFPVQKLFSWGQFLRSRHLRRIVSRYWGDYHDLQGLAAALKGCSIVHSAETFYYCTAQAASLKRTLPLRLVVTVWENIPFLVHNCAAARNKKLVHSQTDVFVAVSERSKEVLMLEGVAEEKIRVIMPGIDVNHFRPAPKDESLLRRYNCRPDDTVVLFVAHLYWEKGIFDVLVAFSRTWKRLGSPPSLKLLVGGAGRERQRLEQWAAELGLGSNLVFLGTHPYSRMPAIHNLADLFVLPSIPTRQWQEQFGYVLIESMACGKPVLTTQSGSIPEVVGDSAVLVPPNDFIALGEAMERLVQDKEHRRAMGLQGRQRVERCFDASTVAEQFRKVYGDLV